MGRLFKALAISDPQLGPLPGFDGMTPCTDARAIRA